MGGSSLIYGRSRSDVASHLTGASIGGASHSSVLLSAWLGEATPPRVLNLWPLALERTIAASTGLQQIANAPLSIVNNRLTQQILAGTVLHQQVSSLVNPLVDQHLWLALLGPQLSLSQTLDPEPPSLSFSGRLV